MMPLPPFEVPSSRLSNDRSTLQLRAYARAEYGSDATWLHSLVRSRGSPWRTRLRRWWRAHTRPRATLRAELRVESPAALPTPAASTPPCTHPVVEDLGFGGYAQFLRCILCGDVLVTRGEQLWRIGSADSATARSASDRLEGELVPSLPDGPGGL